MFKYIELTKALADARPGVFAEYVSGLYYILRGGVPFDDMGGYGLYVDAANRNYTPGNSLVPWSNVLATHKIKDISSFLNYEPALATLGECFEEWQQGKTVFAAGSRQLYSNFEVLLRRRSGDSIYGTLPYYALLTTFYTTCDPSMLTAALSPSDTAGFYVCVNNYFRSVYMKCLPPNIRNDIDTLGIPVIISNISHEVIPILHEMLTADSIRNVINKEAAISTTFKDSLTISSQVAMSKESIRIRFNETLGKLIDNALKNSPMVRILQQCPAIDGSTINFQVLENVTKYVMRQQPPVIKVDKRLYYNLDGYQVYANIPYTGVESMLKAYTTAENAFTANDTEAEIFFGYAMKQVSEYADDIFANSSFDVLEPSYTGIEDSLLSFYTTAVWNNDSTSVKTLMNYLKYDMTGVLEILNDEAFNNMFNVGSSAKHIFITLILSLIPTYALQPSTLNMANIFDGLFKADIVPVITDINTYMNELVRCNNQGYCNFINNAFNKYVITMSSNASVIYNYVRRKDNLLADVYALGGIETYVAGCSINPAIRAYHMFRYALGTSSNLERVYGWITKIVPADCLTLDKLPNESGLTNTLTLTFNQGDVPLCLSNYHIGSRLLPKESPDFIDSKIRGTTCTNALMNFLTLPRVNIEADGPLIYCSRTYNNQMISKVFENSIFIDKVWPTVISSSGVRNVLSNIYDGQISYAEVKNLSTTLPNNKFISSFTVSDRYQVSLISNSPI